MTRYVPLRNLHDPLADRFVPREWLVAIHSAFRFNRNWPSVVVARQEPLSVKPNVFNTLPFDEVVTDSDGMFDPQLSPTAITFRTPGLWYVDWSVGFANDVSTIAREVRCFRNRQEEMIQGVASSVDLSTNTLARSFGAVFEAGEFLELDAWITAPDDTQRDLATPVLLSAVLLANNALDASL